MYGTLARTTKATSLGRDLGSKRVCGSDYHAHHLAYTSVFGSSYVKIGSDLTSF